MPINDCMDQTLFGWKYPAMLCRGIPTHSTTLFTHDLRFVFISCCMTKMKCRWSRSVDLLNSGRWWMLQRKWSKRCERSFLQGELLFTQIHPCQVWFCHSEIMKWRDRFQASDFNTCWRGCKAVAMCVPSIMVSALPHIYAYRGRQHLTNICRKKQKNELKHASYLGQVTWRLMASCLHC